MRILTGLVLISLVVYVAVANFGGGEGDRSVLAASGQPGAGEVAPAPLREPIETSETSEARPVEAVLDDGLDLEHGDGLDASSDESLSDPAAEPAPLPVTESPTESPAELQPSSVPTPVRLEGRVIGLDGAFAPGAIARALPAGQDPASEDPSSSERPVTRTDADGRFRFELAPGDYVLEVAFLPDGPNGAALPFRPRSVSLVAGSDQLVAEFRAALPSVELRGRILSRWGESVEGLEVSCILPGADPRDSVASATTDANGQYVLSGIPLREVLVHVDPLRAESRDGPRLRAPVAPVSVLPLEGQRRVRVDDILVDTLRVFRIAGRVDVSTEALADFRHALVDRYPRARELDDARILRTYVRGLRLVYRNASADSEGTELRVAGDGTFDWSCVLPAEDVIFELSPRTSNPGPGFDGTARVVVTPAGDRTLDLELDYPATKRLSAAQPNPRTGPSSGQ